MPEARSSAAAGKPVSVPPTLRWAVWLLVAQAVVLAAIAAFLVYEDLAAPASSARRAILVTVYVGLMAGVLALLGRALARRRKWARGPAIVLEMLLLPMGYTMVIGGLPWLGVPVMLVGLCGAGLLLAPATRAALGLG